MKGGKHGVQSGDESPSHRLNLTEAQWGAIKVVLDPDSSQRKTSTAYAMLRREPLVAEHLRQDEQPKTLGSPLPPGAFVLPLAIRQLNALNVLLYPDTTKNGPSQEAAQERARQDLRTRGLAVYPSEDYARLSPPAIWQHRRDPQARRVAEFKPGDESPEGFTFLDATGQPTSFEVWLEETRAAQSRHDFRSIFSYFGGKSKLAPLYPEPYFRQVIEPFAGGGSYSLLYADHDVWLNDLNPQTVSIWRFLLRKDALKIIRNRVPMSVKVGTTIRSLTKETDPEGLVWLMRAAAAQGAFGRKSVHRAVTKFAAGTWDTFRARLEYWIPRIQHWKVTRLPYHALPNRKACWFIDPPYANAAGATYARGSKDIDYVELATWCKTRRGQAIVCENAGATWLPFKTLTDKRKGIYNDDMTSTVGEVIWTQADEKRGLWAE